MKCLIALVGLLNTSLLLIIATLALAGCAPALHQAVKTGEELETEELASSFKDYFVGTVKAAFTRRNFRRTASACRGRDTEWMADFPGRL